MTEPLKKKAPVRLSGNAGTRYENEVAARFLLDMLAGTNSAGASFGHIVRIDWQARDLGWLTDDMVLTCQDSRDETRRIGFSMKSNKQVTTNGFPDDFVDLAWGQWLGARTTDKFHRGKDAISLVTATISDDVFDNWSALLKEILATTPDRIVARLDTDKKVGSQASDLQRALVKSFDCPARYNEAPDEVEKIRLLHDVRVLVFDLNRPTSRDHGTALQDCQRLLTSGDAREAESLWQELIGLADELRPGGGSLDLPSLRAKLRDGFLLHDHPDYRADFTALRNRTAEEMGYIETRIGKVAQLPRDDARKTVKDRLSAAKACLLVGESGTGKSALVKEIALADYPLTVWLTRDALDHPNASTFEKALGLRHPLHEVLRQSAGPCLVVFDSLENYSDHATRLCASIAAKMIEPVLAHVHTAFAVQYEGLVKVDLLRTLGVPLSMLEITPLGRANESDVQKLLSSFEELRWLAARPDIAPLLTNLQVLDWFARLGPRPEINSLALRSVTAVIDYLWGLWTESSEDGLTRSHLLMKLAQTEADTLSHGLLRIELDIAAQTVLSSLAQSGLIRLRNDRVFLSHDLLGDWARFRILSAENAISDATLESRSASPPWQQAVRLLGQRLLERSADTRKRWQKIVESPDTDTPSARILRDLFLDALFLAPDAARLLDESWDLLIAQNGKLLKKLLDRFLFVATIPDPRIAAFVGDPSEAVQFEHLVRIPYWLYWPPVLMALFKHRHDAARVAPYAAANVAEMWLRVAPDVMPFRSQAAELALGIAREIQALNEEGPYYSGGADKKVFEAMLYGASYVPQKATALCLELSGRRDISREITTRATQTQEKRRQERAKQPASRASRPLPPMPARRSRPRQPWPDGPRRRVDEDFINACLGPPFVGLIKADPNVALEVLLAVCIEEPQDDDFNGRSSFRECGLSYWHHGEPPTYFRGPFYAFLQLAPGQALTFVIKLTNFGTHQYTQGRSWYDITIDGQAKRWYGDSNVYRWHHDWPMHNGAQLQSALMALEQWFYDEIDQGHSIEAWAKRIVAESESIAFAGLLMDVGKRAPGLFVTTLKPFFFTWELWNVDLQLASYHSTRNRNIGHWGNLPRQFAEMALNYYLLPHRAEGLLFVNGAIPRTMLGHEEHRAFFQSVRDHWNSQLQGEADSNSLRLLIERLNPANYKFEQRDKAIEAVDFQWPEPIAGQNAEASRKSNEGMTIMGLPLRCRKFLDGNHPLPDDQRDWLWHFLQTIEARVDAPPAEGDTLPHLPLDALIGGVAVLLTTSRPWLEQDPQRLAWCRRQLQKTFDQASAELDSEIAIGDHYWDAFAAESGLLLVTADPADALGRSLIAAAATAFRYAATEALVTRGSRLRLQLGDEFGKIVALVVRWAALRPLEVPDSATGLEADREAFRTAKKALIQKYVENILTSELPEFQALNKETREASNAIHERRYPRSAAQRARRHALPAREQRDLHSEQLALDSRLLAAAFLWLDLASAQSPAEKAAELAQLQKLLQLTLGLMPVIEPSSRQRLDDLPSHFDDWLLPLIAKNIPAIAPAQAVTLWQPVLARGATAHHWVERFFWHWFTDGSRRFTSANDFVRTWQSMIEYALGQRTWDPSVGVWHDVESVTIELLGFDQRWDAFFRAVEHADAVATMQETYAQAMAVWGKSSRIVRGFTSFAVMPAANSLLLPGLKWILPTIKTFHSYDWEHGVEDAMIDYLDACWKRRQGEILSDTALREAFFASLAIVTALGSPAALALNARVAASGGTQQG